MKIQKKNLGGGGVGVEGSVGGVGLGWGVRLDVNEIEVFVKIQKKNFWGGGGPGGGGWGVGGGVRLDVNEELKFL